jgi:hypothetical protein
MTADAARKANRIQDRVLALIGLDWTVFSVLLARIATMGSGFVTVLFAAAYLRPEMLGYFFTMNSIVAMQVFFELGLTTAITQYTAHEKASSDVEDRAPNQRARHADRLASFLHQVLRSYLAISAAFLAIVGPAGALFLAAKSTDTVVAWRLPWAVTVCTTAARLVVTAVEAYLEGLGRIRVNSQARTASTVLGGLLTWGLLFWWRDLWAMAVGGAVQLIIHSLVQLYLSGGVLRQVLHAARAAQHRIEWIREVWPYQWRIGVSWLTGYFIFSAFNPAIFYFHGPVMAGQMGLSLAAVNAFATVCGAWLAPKLFEFNALNSAGKLGQLQRSVSLALRHLSIVAGVGSAIIVTAYLAPHGLGARFGQKLIPPAALLAILVAAILQQFVAVVAAFARSFKEEPFLLPSVGGAILCAGMLVPLARYHGTLGAAQAYLTTAVLSGIVPAWFIQRIYNARIARGLASAPSRPSADGERCC